MRLYRVPLELREANALVAMWHRHHKEVQGHRFSIGVIDEDGVLHGAVTVGRTVSREYVPRDVAEATRCVTDGTRNACSFLYGAAAQTAKAQGFIRIQTYTLDSEHGASLRAAGWTYEGPAGGGQWQHTDGKPRRTDQPTELKGRWARSLNKRPAMVPLVLGEDVPQMTLEVA